MKRVVVAIAVVTACTVIGRAAGQLSVDDASVQYQLATQLADENRYLEAIDAFHGPYQCHMAGACSQACPKGVDPAFAIQLLKRTLVLDGFGFGKKKSSLAKVMPLADVVKAIEEFAPPPRTVGK